MKIKIFLLSLFLDLVALTAIWIVPRGVASPQEIENQPTATISGIVTHDNTPVAGITILASCDSGTFSATTGQDGSYAISGIPTGGWVNLHVKPPIELRLAFRNLGISSLSGDLTQNIALIAGYRLKGAFYYPDGRLFDHYFWLSATDLVKNQSPYEWLGTEVEKGSFDLVLPPGIYVLSLGFRPTPYSMPLAKVDLRNSDVGGYEIILMDKESEARPTTPPDARLIQVSEPNMDGVATIQGLAGAVAPLSSVLVVNLDTGTPISTTSEQDGSFTTSLFSPPGSSLLIKYDVTGESINTFWKFVYTPEYGGVEANLLPGTILTVGDPPAGNEKTQEFNAVGLLQGGDWAAWWAEGVLEVEQGGGPPGLVINPGEIFTISLHVKGTSPALSCENNSPIPIDVEAQLQYLFDSQGKAASWNMWFGSYLFTPTDLPIEHESDGLNIGLAFQTIQSLNCLNEHTFEGEVTLVNSYPSGAPDGIYKPRIYITADIPGLQDAPSVVIWYQNMVIGDLPMIRIGNPIALRIPWVILGDNLVDGLRGQGARQDVGNFQMVTRVRYPTQELVIPARDARTQELIQYRLEPGSHWISSTDRRMPCPPHIKFAFPSGVIQIEIHKPDGNIDRLGPSPILQSSVRTPTVPGGTPYATGTGHIGDMFHLATLNEAFEYSFEQYGRHVIQISGEIQDIYGNTYQLESTYDVIVAQLLDLDPAQLPTTPYLQGDFFAPGLHLYPPIPADVRIQLVHMPNSDPTQAITHTIEGKTNPYGYFQPPAGSEFQFNAPGEFRVDMKAIYQAEDGTLWEGEITWGNVVEGGQAQIEAHGRRGMDYHNAHILPDMPAWFENAQLPPEMVGIENYYPYFSGDIHWGMFNLDAFPNGDSIHTILTFSDLTGANKIYYNILRDHFSRATNCFRWPPDGCSLQGLEERLAIDEAPLFISTKSGIDPTVNPEEIDLWGYWYGSSERPDVHVREIISEDNMGTAYWRFDDTYGYQISEPADGDMPGDIKWEFGGVVLRVPDRGIQEYAIYSSLWVLLPYEDPIGARVTPPFRGLGALDGGPILTLLGEEIDLLFLPKGIRPGDILEIGDLISFSGHVGPPLNSRVDVTITSPGGIAYSRSLRANRIGWVYEPSFDLIANEVGRWTVEVFAEHDQPYPPTGIIPFEHNTGTVLGTSGHYEFYVVEAPSPGLLIQTPQAGMLQWINGRVAPVEIRGLAPASSTTVYYTLYDKGMVMGQGSLTPDVNGSFTYIYDAKKLHEDFPMLALTAHEGLWEGLSDEVSIRFLAVGSGSPRAGSVTLIGEEVYLTPDASQVFLPFMKR